MKARLETWNSTHDTWAKKCEVKILEISKANEELAASSKLSESKVTSTKEKSFSDLRGVKSLHCSIKKGLIAKQNSKASWHCWNVSIF
jgi:hypothetical protein